ncbi:uncharacterized protein LOC125560735 [Nematostella vectensis]|uniref:uncharacterized protein LOC125560735 n=1 Tax=Nematostella vectensis TaxID=45351 RepID=UPI0020777F5B|nr:uncharacterized protein LOC125560735 [Nematostella vectensis]
MAMALQLPITILAIVLNVLDSSVSEVCSSEAPFAIPGVQGNLEFKASSFKVNQPRSSAFAFINSLSRQRHGRMLGPVLNDSTSPRISLILIIMANDCSTMNPGPVKDPCGICQKPTRSNQRAIQCDECDMWYHTKCIAMTAQSYDRLGSDSQLAWLCNKCLFPNFSTTFLLNEMDLCHENRFESLSSDSTISSDPGSPLFTSSPSRFHDPQGNRVKITRRKLKILSLNCNGLKSPAKKSQFQSLVALHDPDVILGCESKINAIIPTYSIFPENYEVYRRDRTASGGGVFIAVRNDLTAVEERGLDVNGAEMITASIHLAKRKKLFLTSFYHPPTDQEGLGLLDDYLCKLFTKYQQCPNAIIGGDFNCSGIEWSSGEAVLTPPVHSWDLALIALAEKYGLSQHVKSPTRYDSFLDLAFSSKPGLVNACHVTSGLSDHSAVLFEVDLAPKYIPKPPRKIYLYHKADIAALKEHIASFHRDYAASHMERSVEENWNAISTCISDAMERFIPSKTSKTKRLLPWIGAPIKKLMRKRDRAFKKSKRTGKEKDHVNYKRLRNIVSNSIKESHNNYVSEIMKGIDLESDEPRPNGVKGAWSYLKLLRSESLGIPTLFWEGRVCANDKCKAEALRAQYDSVFTQEDNLNVPTLGASPHQDIKDISFSVNGVRVQLDNIRVDKACGPDAVPARVLKEAATELAPILTLLFEQSMKDGVLPTVWKDANISAIYKKGLKI